MTKSPQSEGIRGEQRLYTVLYRSLERLSLAIEGCAAIGFQESSPTTNAEHASRWNDLNEAQKDAKLKLKHFARASAPAEPAPQAGDHDTIPNAFAPTEPAWKVTGQDVSEANYKAKEKFKPEEGWYSNWCDAVANALNEKLTTRAAGAVGVEELLRKLAANWIDTGLHGTGLRTDSYVTEHKTAIMGVYESNGKLLLEYLDYRIATAPASRAKSKEEAK